MCFWAGELANLRPDVSITYGPRSEGLLGNSREFLSIRQVPMIRRALNFDGDSCRWVVNVSAKLSVRREPIDVRPESDSLHHSGDLDFLADFHDLQPTGAAARERSRLRSSQASHSVNPSRVWQETRTMSMLRCTRRAFSSAAAILNGT